jgi:hypothetical protein
MYSQLRCSVNVGDVLSQQDQLLYEGGDRDEDIGHAEACATQLACSDGDALVDDELVDAGEQPAGDRSLSPAPARSSGRLMRE